MPASITKSLILTATLAALAFANANDASADAKRVVVAKFDGPEQTATEIRTAVLEVLEDFYDVVPYRKYRIERRRLGMEKQSKKKNIAQVARRLGADAIIYGVLEGDRLTVRVREGDSGVLIGKFRVPVRDPQSESFLEQVENELTDLIDATEDVEEGSGSLTDAIGDDRAGAMRVATAEPTVKQPWDERPDEADATPSKPSPIGLQAALGVGGTARTLEFAYQGGLTEDERPQAMSGSPALGVAFHGVANIKALGLSAEAEYQRSVGASISIRDGAGAKRVGMSQRRFGLRLFVERPFGDRVSLRGGAGYHQTAFTLSNKPNGLRLHDTRYSFIDVGGGARVNLRDKRVAVTADASYLYVLAMGGISDPTAYGSGRAQGVAGELGLELEATESTFVRVALNYSRLVIYFDGTGELATNLDDSSDIDVSGAADANVGGTAMMGFHF